MSPRLSHQTTLLVNMADEFSNTNMIMKAYMYIVFIHVDTNFGSVYIMNRILLFKKEVIVLNAISLSLTHKSFDCISCLSKLLCHLIRGDII